ncbi:hypothetical protein Mkiyose1665_33060 [Mycobacterium kiyosense]|uniref:Uncharacterized protein n=1 Tax=Mycobacterium kiyosense TaxID=2871094 RepID=A0A9P3Q706_9MYCO|nr:hypothetical protein IWGMT90018_43090 [Mycobacterium kiyosense]BDE15419.1 hypothetical protein MKCMC460_42790 [Mycobacterium sp. 20KCMC460]GLB82693.1 hypothetical protein SRL2020028_19490 [Mycobacterium kiyosense]GLB90156.1 hypothetical protein SRL2020130_29730 [Mycobacterium kiyosense]GLB95745.1 hypothetical protein SRL2020226_25210 [Mycobacterium kiyosense]
MSVPVVAAAYSNDRPAPPSAPNLNPVNVRDIDGRRTRVDLLLMPSEAELADAARCLSRRS